VPPRSPCTDVHCCRTECMPRMQPTSPSSPASVSPHMQCSRSSGGSPSHLTLGRATGWALQSSGRNTLGACVLASVLSRPRPCAYCVFCLRLALSKRSSQCSFMTLTIYHPVGTAKMGLVGGSIPDAQLMMCIQQDDLLFPSSHTRQIQPPWLTSACVSLACSGCGLWMRP